MVGKLDKNAAKIKIQFFERLSIRDFIREKAGFSSDVTPFAILIGLFCSVAAAFDHALRYGHRLLAGQKKSLKKFGIR